MNFIKEKLLLTGILTALGIIAGFGQMRLNVQLNFKTDSTLPEGNYYVMTKDSIKHFYSDVDGFKLYKKKRYVLSETESYPADEVIAYKAIYKRYANVKNYILEYSRINGVMVPKYIPGRINVFDYLDLMKGDIAPRIYYLQKGDRGPIIELTTENAKTVIYNMLKDYEPSKNIMDKKGTSIKTVEEAVNAYNIRKENKNN